MRGTKGFIYLVCVATAGCIATLTAQQPSPMIIVQPANAANAPAPAPAAAAPSSSESAVAAAIKTLEQVKASNEATLKKQEAMLQQLDELQKAAEQLKVFSKRV